MTEEELKNKCKERAKIFQQAMESCKSSNPIDCIEWFADRIADLEKENAELKEHHKSVCETLTNTHRSLREQLTKAKEILEELAKMEYVINPPVDKVRSLMVKAEQFLKEIEK